MRVALVTNIPSPYRIPVWQEIHRQIGPLTVFLCAETEPNRVWAPPTEGEVQGLAIHVLPGLHWYVQQRDWGIHINPGLTRALARIRPEAIIVTGYETPSYLMAMRYAKRNGIPLVLWWGSHAGSSRSKQGMVASFRRRVVHWPDAYITYGSLATEYLVSMGIDSSRIVTGCNAIDVTRLHELVEQQQSIVQQGTTKVVRFLYVGRLVEFKGVQELIRAFMLLNPTEAELTIVGYGPLEQKLRQIVTESHAENIRFAGKARTMEQLAVHYAAADVLVMPSLNEVWGLVVNEALAAGLYVLSSKYAGATPDLIAAAPYRVGDVIDPLDNLAFERKLKETILQVRMGLDRNAIAQWGLQHTPKAYADAVCQAMAIACERHSLSLGTLSNLES